MQLVVILDNDGKLVAAMKETSRGKFRVGFRPSAQQKAHRVEIPSEFEKLRLRNLMVRLKFSSEGLPHF